MKCYFSEYLYKKKNIYHKLNRAKTYQNNHIRLKNYKKGKIQLLNNIITYILQQTDSTLSSPGLSLVTSCVSSLFIFLVPILSI